MWHADLTGSPWHWWALLANCSTHHHGGLQAIAVRTESLSDCTLAARPSQPRSPLVGSRAWQQNYHRSGLIWLLLPLLLLPLLLAGLISQADSTMAEQS